MLTSILRRARRLLGSKCPSSDPVFGRIDLQFCRAQYLVRFYYLASVFISYLMIPEIHSIAKESAAWDFLWPVAWLSAFKASDIVEWISVASLAASMLAFQFPANRLSRVLFAVLFLLTVAIENSQGAMDHAYHAWLWIGICFVFLPRLRSTGALPRVVKMAYLTVIASTQTLILLFYSIAGFWKVFQGLKPLLQGTEGNFAPRGLALQLADRMLTTGTSPLLGDFAVANYWLIWPMFLFLIYVQLVAVLVALRPRLHIAWGYILIIFHIGTWLLMEIEFPEHVLLLGLLFVMSPFRPRQWNFRDVLSDLPGFGLLVRLLGPMQSRERGALGRAYSAR